MFWAVQTALITALVVTFAIMTTIDYGIIFSTATAPAPVSMLERSTIVTIHQLLNQVQTWQRSQCHDDHQDHYTHQPQCQQDGGGHCNFLTQSPPARPFVTATFAQSVDGFMSPFIHQESGGTDTVHPTTPSNYPLSSRESLLLTHGLRSIHDGILIGGRTLLLDNPRLTNRLWGIVATNHNGTTHDEGTATTIMPNLNTTEDNPSIHLPTKTNQPQPIIIDPNLRYIQQLLRETNGTMNLRHPIVCCTFDAASSSNQLNQYHYHRDQHDHNFRNNISNNTIRLLPCRSNHGSDNNVTTSALNVTDVLHRLYQEYDLRSIMVEGGAYTLSTFFTAPSSVLVDVVIITIAPQLLYHGIRPIFGPTLGPFSSRSKENQIDALRLISSSTSFTVLGNDATLIARCDQSKLSSEVYSSK